MYSPPMATTEPTSEVFDPVLVHEISVQFDQDDYDQLIARARRIRDTGGDHWAFVDTMKLGFGRLVSPLL